MKTDEQKSMEDRIAKAKALLGEISTWKKWMEDVAAVTSVTLKKPMLDGQFRDVELTPWGKKDLIEPHGKSVVATLLSFGDAEITRIQAEYDAL
jgi:hypothetical protein